MANPGAPWLLTQTAAMYTGYVQWWDVEDYSSGPIGTGLASSGWRRVNREVHQRARVSRAQHQLIKNIKHSADGIQPKLLGRVLGDIQCFHVHPYETFEEEEKQRLHEHWLKSSIGWYRRCPMPSRPPSLPKSQQAVG
ncbi:hypothetical protein MUK42_07344 [Musa troglodytarum]|uniref:Uncharacterized protein n=1 Tax=Musa troglodytarum TaxID=320322 RepID=A0A9E7H347_9LILI|nr:hypothetical protein MUK42_07344 [Musa troglodytarum]